MKINVSNIPEGGINLRFERNGEWFQQRLPETGSGGFVLDRAGVACAVRRMKENVFIEGSITTAAEMPCSRCLETTRLSLQSSFHYTFAPPPSLPQEDVELSATDLDFAYYEEDVIDLDAAVFEQILLQIPFKPLCAESCRGLCPHCGANLNATSCDCRSEIPDERLAILKQFKAQP
ncbi:MAG: DUF177 domain-containing protein [Deltaproteobacteria bacterium]|nr:DUF177 domain-containing protein [Deltaproteobacteria bacterium]